MKNYGESKRVIKLSEMDRKVILSYSRSLEGANGYDRNYTQRLKECITYCDRLYRNP